MFCNAEFKDNLVEHHHDVGIMVIKNPFVEEENKSVSIYKEMSEAEFGFMSRAAKEKYLTTVSSATATYTL